MALNIRYIDQISERAIVMVQNCIIVKLGSEERKNGKRRNKKSKEGQKLYQIQNISQFLTQMICYSSKHKVIGKEEMSWRSDWTDVKHLFKSDVNIELGDLGDDEEEDNIDVNNDKEDDGDDGDYHVVVNDDDGGVDDNSSSVLGVALT